MKPKHTETGRWGEEIATKYLVEKGYRILHRNWRAERGDIDLVCLDGSCLVFVEVKTGFSQKYGPPELRITASKKRQLIKLAEIYLQQNENNEPGFSETRFDVIVIDGNKKDYQIRHYKNAIYS